MKPETMAKKLRDQGWRVEPPLTQENCSHEYTFGSATVSTDGSGSSHFRCVKCGKNWTTNYPPNPKGGWQLTHGYN